MPPPKRSCTRRPAMKCVWRRSTHRSRSASPIRGATSEHPTSQVDWGEEGDALARGLEGRTRFT